MHRFELTDKEPFFNISNKLNLSFTQPGPIDLDISIFNQSEINWLSKAKLAGILKITNLNPDLNPDLNPKIIPTVKPSIKKSNIVADREVLINTLTSKLSEPINSIYLFVDKTESLLHLRLLGEIEMSKKNRSKLVSTINKKIELISSKVSSIVGEPLSEKNIQKEYNLPEVEEELEDTVKITIGE